MPIKLAEGYKFGLMAVPEAKCPAALVRVDDEFLATSHLPDGAIDTWRDDIGRFHAKELQEAGLFLWVLQPTNAPEIVDEENRLLGKRAYDFFLGVLIATPYFTNGRLTRLTGANVDGSARARSLAAFGRSYQTLGSPPPNLTRGKLKVAASLAKNIVNHNASQSHTRMVRALRSFREATEARPLDLRLHQFVRCAEAFAVPPTKGSAVNFARRLARLCTGEAYDDIKELYDIRSGIEHLHGPYDRMPDGLSDTEQHFRLLQRCVQAEALARFLLHTYFMTPDLWPYFESRDTIQEFWKKSEDAILQTWPSRLAFRSVLRDFDADAAERSIQEGPGS